MSAEPQEADAGPVRAGGGDVLVSIWRHRASDRSRNFPRVGLGHRGYEVAPVDDFADRVLADLARAEQEIGDLRAEIDRLHRYIRRQWSAVAAAEAAAADAAEAAESADRGPGTPRQPAASQARAVLNQAQELADARLAEAAHRLAQAEVQAAERLAGADRLVAERLAEADAIATARLTRAEQAAARRLASADAMAERLLVQTRADHRVDFRADLGTDQSRPAALSAR